MEDETWHDRPSVAIVAGVAGFVLLGLLALAVIRTSDNATEPAPFVAPLPSTTTSASTIKPLTSSSYTVPSVQTSQETPGPTMTTSNAPPAEGPGGPPEAPPTPTTIFNPYATTPSQSAGHV